MADNTHPKHAAVVAWAKKQIGETENPHGSNRGPFVQLCQTASWLPGTGYPWCRCFVLRAHLQAGFTLPDKSPGAWDALNRARQRGDALSPAGYQRVIPGDEVIWAFGSGHSSIYTGHSTIHGAVYIDSIDGNVSDQVKACSRPLAEVKGFVVWHEAPTVARPQRKPLASVVGGVSGRRKLVVGHLKVPLPRKKPGNRGVDPDTHRENARAAATSPPKAPTR